MDGYKKRAKGLYKQGYNCAQSVFAAFCEDIGMDFETAIKISSSFGGGMGKLREVCGAVSAMFMIAGIKYGYTSPTDDTLKTEHYKLIQTLAGKFKDKHDTIICRELLGLDEDDGYIPEKRTKEYYKKRPCANFVGSAAQIMQELIKEKETV